MPIRVGIIVGERSGDLLGSALIKALRELHPDIEFEGILGEQLIALGGKSLFDMERLAVMGFVDPLKRLPELLRIRKTIIQHFIKHPPDVFIGIDAPDFNLGVELKLKQSGIPVIHYVSPSVWAWRKYRIKKIKRAVNKMLTLFPFETKIYEQHQIPATCVGHPMADDIPLEHDPLAARKDLALADARPVVAILPGSRSVEIKHLSATYLQAAKLVASDMPEVSFVIPFANEALKEQFLLIKETEAPELAITMLVGQAHQVFTAADVVLATAGTATLEAMCFHKPLVVAYKTSKFNFMLAKWLVDVDFIALPNLLFGKMIAPEYLQDNATPENISLAIMNFIKDEALSANVTQEFKNKHTALQCDAGKRAAIEISTLLST